jgi:Berberine and berberine like
MPACPTGCATIGSRITCRRSATPRSTRSSSTPGQHRHRSPYIILFHLGGAIRRRAPADSAFEDRGAEHALNINAAWSDPETDAAQIAWARRLFEAMQPFASGVYVNFLGEEDEERVRAAYGPEKYERLARIKAAYDADNVFRLNQNIRPAGC